MSAPKNELKIVVTGMTGVGRTRLIKRFVYHYWDDGSYESALEDEYVTTVTVDGENIKMKIIPISIDDPYAFTDYLIKSSDGIVFIYDITKRESFDVVRDLYEHLLRVKDICEDDDPPSGVMICGNQCDQAAEREVSTEEGESLSNSLHSAFFEASAKSGENVELLFVTLAQMCLESNDNSCNDKNKGKGKGCIIC